MAALRTRVSNDAVLFTLGGAEKVKLSANSAQLVCEGPGGIPSRISNIAKPEDPADAVPLGWAYSAVGDLLTANTTPFPVPATTQIIQVDTTGIPIRLDLPSAADGGVRQITIFDQSLNCEENNITIFPYVAELVEGAISITLEVDGSSVTLLSDGIASWHVI